MTYRITGKMLRDYQLDIVRPLLCGKKKHAFIVLPRRSGKSVVTFYIVNALVNQYWIRDRMPVNATIFAPEQKQCREIYLDNILSDGRKLPDITNGRLIESRLSIEYGFGSKIKLSGSDRIDSRMGSGNKIVVLDEHALSKSDIAFQRLYPMIVDTDGHMIVVTTPRGKNHAHELFELVKNDPNWLIVHAHVFDLGLMSQEQYDAIPMHPNLKRQEFLCSWESPFENAVYLDPQECEHEYNPNYPLYASIDFGMRDKQPVVLAQLINDEIRIIHSFEDANVGIDITGEKILSYLDKVGHSLFDFELFIPHDAGNRLPVGMGEYSRETILKSLGIRTTRVPRAGLMEGIDLVRRMWHKMYFSKNAGIVTDKIKSYVTDPNSGIPKHDDSSHAADAVRYLVTGLVKVGGYIGITSYEDEYYLYRG